MYYGLKVLVLNWRYSVLRVVPLLSILAIGFYYSWTCLFASDTAAAISVPSSIVLLIIALFPEVVRGFLWPAILEIRVEMDPLDAAWVPLADGRTQRFYYQLRVYNRGPATARNVSLYVERIEEVHGKTKTRRGFVPLNLCWAYKKDNPFYPYIPANVEHVCTLGYLPKDTHRTPERRFSLDLEVEPTGDRHVLSPGTYLLHLRALADNSAPCRGLVRLEISFKILESQAEGETLLQLVSVTTA